MIFGLVSRIVFSRSPRVLICRVKPFNPALRSFTGREGMSVAEKFSKSGIVPDVIATAPLNAVKVCGLKGLFH